MIIVELASSLLEQDEGSITMEGLFAERIKDVPRSFVREILKVAGDETIISFAGGLPNRDLFPIERLQAATNKLFEESGKEILQYSETEGYFPLRQWIAARYQERKGITINPKNVLITTGSQQGLDLLGKIFVDAGDKVILEKPAYLGAIQAFSLYRPRFEQIPLETDGVNLERLEKSVRDQPAKLFYCVPNFQNPSGVTYSEGNRRDVASVFKGRDMVLVEDDPYGELRFLGQEQPTFYRLLSNNVILLGSFSKIVTPSFRIGWMVANDEIIDKLVVAKQASDLHTNYFGQRIIHRYLEDNDIDEHINRIREAYGRQRNAMLNAMGDYFPSGVEYTTPEGGMFLWATLPNRLSALEVFDKAIASKVAFVPGDPFYIDEKNTNTMRINFSSVNEATIRIGIERLGRVLKDLM